MDFTRLITILKKQLQLYTSLHGLAVKKVEIIKTGDLDALNQMIKDEQTHTAAITLLENERLQTIKELFPNNNELPTMSECIDKAYPEQRPILVYLYKKLMETLQKTKEQNDLNQQLIYQSLQFVNFSLNLVQPKPESVTYGPPNGKKQTELSDTTSVFNSKV